MFSRPKCTNLEQTDLDAQVVFDDCRLVNVWGELNNWPADELSLTHNWANTERERENLRTRGDQVSLEEALACFPPFCSAPTIKILVVVFQLLLLQQPSTRKTRGGGIFCDWKVSEKEEAQEEEEESVAKEDQYRLLVLHRILAHARAADSCTTRRWFEARPHPLRAWTASACSVQKQATKPVWSVWGVCDGWKACSPLIPTTSLALSFSLSLSLSPYLLILWTVRYPKRVRYEEQRRMKQASYRLLLLLLLFEWKPFFVSDYS